MSLSCVLLHSTVFVGAIGYVILALLCCAAGIVMYGYYLQIGCDPLEAGQLYSPNQVCVVHFLQNDLVCLFTFKYLTP